MAWILRKTDGSADEDNQGNLTSNGTKGEAGKEYATPAEAIEDLNEQNYGSIPPYAVEMRVVKKSSFVSGGYD